jgi:hypothetical protein
MEIDLFQASNSKDFMKYQFCIRFNEIDVNSSATKAVVDCNAIFSANGYQDFTVVVPHNADRKKYYVKLFKAILNFFFSVKSRSIVGIQYPLLSINNVFKYFMSTARLKSVKFFCVVHDIESLRTGGKDQDKIQLEVNNLNCYDLLIVHNQYMMNWLTSAGVTTPMVKLGLFDYLTDLKTEVTGLRHTIVYAGNLAKSTFIYAIPAMADFNFTVYGPGCDAGKLPNHVKWGGVFSPDEVVAKMEGGFGLIWDGSETDRCDEILGNYLYYNNPHKASLYLAAGLPLIAPEGTAIGKFILQEGIGFVVKSLHDLQAIKLDESQYQGFKINVNRIQQKVSNGYFFNEAIHRTEQTLDYRMGRKAS